MVLLSWTPCGGYKSSSVSVVVIPRNECKVISCNLMHKPTFLPTQRVKCSCSGGMPGIPGMPGMPGPYGARGDKGDSGSRGERGPTGIMGTPGPRGTPGEKGGRGSRGQTGTPGKTGPSGAKGDRGSPGTKGDAGPKGDAAGAGPIPATNWKQCVWKNINDAKDSGKLKVRHRNRKWPRNKINWYSNSATHYVMDL